MSSMTTMAPSGAMSCPRVSRIILSLLIVPDRVVQRPGVVPEVGRSPPSLLGLSYPNIG